jgi:hypothetical protein
MAIRAPVQPAPRGRPVPEAAPETVSETGPVASPGERRA